MEVFQVNANQWALKGALGTISQWESSDSAPNWNSILANIFTVWSISNCISFIGIWSRLCRLLCTIRSFWKSFLTFWSFSKGIGGIKSFGTRIDDASADIILESRSSVWFETCLSVSTKDKILTVAVHNDHRRPESQKKVTFKLNMKDFTLKQTTTTFTSLAFQGSYAITVFAFFSFFLNATIAFVWIVFRTFIAFHWKFWTKFTVDITQSKAFSAAENHFRMRHLKKFSDNL